MTKEKGHQKFSAFKWKFFPKKRSFENLVGENLFRSPKLGARSPPMPMSHSFGTFGKSMNMARVQIRISVGGQ